jgi:hypothetical protein
LTTPEAEPQQEPANANAPEGANAQLLTALKSTPSKRLAKVVQRIDALTPEDEEALERGDKFVLKAKLRKLQGWAYHVLFWAGVAVAVIFVLALCAMISLYIAKVNAEGKIESVMASILTFVAGIVVTLAVERFAKRKD